MSWDKKLRGGNRRYYYSGRRINGRWRKIYVGRGPAAELMARLDERDRRERLEERAAWSVEQARIATAGLAVREARDLIRLLVTATLIVTGHHLHHGQWRRRRSE